jgi:mannose/cellobiose epimerase-like protein (N-acyl-D-glucosamine 2-epimerase family)
MARFCATRGWDAARSQSVERLQADLTPAPLGYRRGMVAGRQLFFFSHAYRLMREPIFEDRARRLFADLVSHSGIKRTVDGTSVSTTTTRRKM